jgi:hypothetical protein
MTPQADPWESDRSIGWKVFAGFMITMVGAFNIADGLVAITDETYFERVGGSDLLPMTNNLKFWGWVVFIWGLVLIVSGSLIFIGNQFGRVVGLLAAGGNAIVQLLFLPHYPHWSAIIVLTDVLVIYALAVHGGRLFTDSERA